MSRPFSVVSNHAFSNWFLYPPEFTCALKSKLSIETIISRDKKDATYKLALLRALCDTAQTDSGMVRWGMDGAVRVPLGSIVGKWILYYWPIIELDGPDGPDGKVAIPQKRGLEKRMPIAFRSAMRELIRFYTSSRFFLEFDIRFPSSIWGR